MPKLSIIVPVYKVEPFLRRCVDSILCQTFEDFELILVDDGSPDNCGAICDVYATKDSRVHVIHQENGGPAAARNAGIEMATGEYFLFCDSDDYVGRNWCRNLIDQAKAGKKSFIFGGTIIVLKGETGTSEQERKPCETARAFPLEMFLPLQIRAIVGYPWNVLFDASVIRTYRLRFPTDVIVEDLPSNLEYLKHMDELFFSGESNYYYVQDERATLSRKYYPEGFRRWQEKYRATLSFIENQYAGEQKEAIHKAVADAYVYPFLSALENTFDPRNQNHLLSKLAHNAEVVKSAEFRDCFRHADTSGENPKYIRALKVSYYLAFLVQFGAKAKRRLRREAL